MEEDYHSPRYIPTLNYEIDHLQELGSILNEFRNEESLCDVLVTVGNKSFRAHKAILAASSGYFNAMFTGGFQESGMSEVSIPGDETIFESLLEYVYTGRFYVPPDRTTDVLAFACYLQIRYAVEVCTEYLCSRLNQQNLEGVVDDNSCQHHKLKDVIKVWQTADNHGLFELRDAADQCVCLNFWTFSKTEDFSIYMPFELLSDLLERGELAACSSEEEVRDNIKTMHLLCLYRVYVSLLKKGDTWKWAISSPCICRTLMCLIFRNVYFLQCLLSYNMMVLLSREII